MEGRGRKSAASLTVVSPDGFEVSPRPQPPEELNEEQAQEWRSVVNRLPADWFPRETHALLSQYCRHVVSARRIEQLIDACEQSEDFDVREYNALLLMRERESRMIASLATKMRISQQTTYDKSRKKPLNGRKPWETKES